jgi:hypothetical protein
MCGHERRLFVFGKKIPTPYDQFSGEENWLIVGERGAGNYNKSYYTKEYFFVQGLTDWEKYDSFKG